MRRSPTKLRVITQPVAHFHLSTLCSLFPGQSLNLWLNGSDRPVKITAPDEGIESFYSLAEVYQNGKFAEYVIIKEWN